MNYPTIVELYKVSIELTWKGTAPITFAMDPIPPPTPGAFCHQLSTLHL